MKKITLRVALMVLPFFGFAQVTNSTFDTDVAGWSAKSGATVVHNAAEDATTPGTAGTGAMSITTGGANGRAQSDPNTPAVDGGGEYILSFKAKGPAGTNIGSQIFQSAGANTQGTDLTMTGSYEDYSFTFDVEAAGQLNVRIIGRDASTTYFIDDVTFTKVPCSGTEITLTNDGGGTSSVTAGADTCYTAGNMIEFTAAPACGDFTFNEWIIDGTSAGSANPLTYTVPATDVEVKATFTATATPDLTYDDAIDLAKWVGNSNGSSDASSGDLVMTITGGTPKVSYNCSIAGSAWNINAVEIIYDNTGSTNTALRFKHPKLTEAGDNYVEAVINSSATGTVEIPLNNADWGDFMNNVEILVREAGTDPAVNGTFIINSIRFYNNPSLSVEKFATANTSFKVYPNPAKNNVTIEGANDIKSVTLFDITGKVVLRSNAISNNTLDLSGVNAGVYLLNITDVNNSTTTKKLIKQ